MNKRMLLPALALLALLAANLHPCCRVRIDGEWDGALYPPAQLRRGLRAAAAAAAEILPGEETLPVLEARLVFSLRPPEGNSRRLSALLLSRTEGVASLCAVEAGGERFGLTEDREKTEERLRAALYRTMPAGATRAFFAEGIEFRPLYGREGSALAPGDIALAVSGAVPAVYTDGEGHRISG